MNEAIVLFDTILNFTIEANIKNSNHITYNVFWNGVDIGHNFVFYDDAVEYCYFNFDHHDNWEMKNIDGVYHTWNQNCDFYADFQNCVIKSKSIRDFKIQCADCLTMADFALACRTIQNYKGMWYYTLCDDYNDVYIGKRQTTVYVYGLDTNFKNELQASKIMDAINSLYMKTDGVTIEDTIKLFNHESSATSQIDLIVEDVDKLFN